MANRKVRFLSPLSCPLLIKPLRGKPSWDPRVIEGFSARLEVLPYDDKAAIHTGQIRAELARRGKPIGPYDQVITGHARSQSSVLVTNNVKKFRQVSGLRLENWVGKGPGSWQSDIAVYSSNS